MNRSDRRPFPACLALAFASFAFPLPGEALDLSRARSSAASQALGLGLGAFDLAQAPAAAGAPVFDAVPAAEVESALRFGKWDAGGEIGLALDKWAAWGSKGGESAKAEAFARKALERLGRAPEGRQVLRDVIEASRALGMTVLVRAESFSESRVVKIGGIECLIGKRGWSNPRIWSYSFNGAYMEMEDQELALDLLASNMAHEFRHLANWAAIAGSGPELREAFSRSLVNEQNARLSGYLVALQLGGRPNEYTQAAAALARDPSAFYDKLKKDYPDQLDAGEMGSPEKAYRARLQALKADREALERRGKEIRAARHAITILSSQEGLAGALRDLRGEARFYEEVLPMQIEAVESKIASVERRASASPAPEDDLLKDEAFQGLVERARRNQAALVDLARARPVPEPRLEEGQLTPEQFRLKALESQRLNPGYWAGYWEKFGKDEAGPRLDPIPFN
jgi:hypothetical protein